MNCSDFREYCLELLDNEVAPGEDRRAELQAHRHSCAECSRYLDDLAAGLAAVRPSAQVSASPGFKETVMAKIVASDNQASAHVYGPRWFRARVLKPALAGGIAAALIVAATLLWRQPAKPQETPFSILSQAFAAEEPLFAGSGIIDMVAEITVKAVTDPTLAKIRWLPITTIDASGKVHFDQLSLPAEPGEEYFVREEVWYEPMTGRSARVFTARDRLVFANSYDGAAVYSLETDSAGASRIVKSDIAADFQPPARAASILGLAAGQSQLLKPENKDFISDAGSCTLADGAEGQAIRVGSGSGAPGPAADSFWLFRVRKSDSTIAEMEWFAAGHPMLLVRRVSQQTVASASWDLSAFKSQLAAAGKAPERPVTVTPDMVIPDVSVQSMVKKADFETYIFSAAPPWAGERQITDILDVASPPHRMFSIAYAAKDSRHVVFIQSYTYNVGLGPLAKSGTLVYTSPNGCKVWASDKGKWLAEILLRSSAASIGQGAIAENRVGYLIETPAGTFPALAVNGAVSDDELHALVDSLVPAKEYKGK